MDVGRQANRCNPYWQRLSEDSPGVWRMSLGRTASPPVTLAKPVSDWAITPPSPALCGVFRFYLRTSLPRHSPVSRSYRPFFSKPPDFAILVQVFNRPSGAGFRVVRAGFVLAYVLGSAELRTASSGNDWSKSGTCQRASACFSANAVIEPVAKLGQQCAGHLKYGQSYVISRCRRDRRLVASRPCFQCAIGWKPESSKYLP